MHIYLVQIILSTDVLQRNIFLPAWDNPDIMIASFGSWPESPESLIERVGKWVVLHDSHASGCVVKSSRVKIGRETLLVHF